MNARKLMIPVFFLLLAVSGLARALDIQPYTANALQQAQASGKPVAVHFHADWCPTCKAQEQAFNSLRGDPKLKGITAAGRQLRQRAGTEEGHEREVAVGGRGFPGQQGNCPHRRRNQAREDQGRTG